MFDQIQTASLDWKTVDGIDIPMSTQFGDVYFSKDNGLLETRHVFLDGNDLSDRLLNLQPYEYFCVGETGFGTGLNILALLQLWQNVRPNNQSHLHAVSVEKFPLSKTDLIRALAAWEELAPLSKQLIDQYPTLTPGCHRLVFAKERFSLDLWLGDAQDIFPIIPKTHTVNAWFLDGFAPSCNPELWEENVLRHVVRLSNQGTTFSSFSVAGVLKRGLKAHGIEISRPRGFGHKKEMLKAIWPHDNKITHSNFGHKKIAIIGAGIAGLSVAWSFAQLGHTVHLFEKTHPLNGASGNPLALLNPKLCPITQCHAHLMTLSWQYGLSHYQQFRAFRAIAVEQVDIKQNDELKKLIDDYPDHELSHVEDSVLESDYARIQLQSAGAVSPHHLCEEILAHPCIHLHIQEIDNLHENDDGVELIAKDKKLLQANTVVVCTALESKKLFLKYPQLKPIRGQVSWCNVTQPLPINHAFSYGGYCMQLDTQSLILGASFHPQRSDEDVLIEDHEHNLALIEKIYPEYAKTLPECHTWQGRASIRAQSLDYFPLVGNIEPYSKIYTLAGLGSKGFLFAPLCSEIIIASVLNHACPVPQQLVDKLSPQRFLKKPKPKKPYYQHH